MREDILDLLEKERKGLSATDISDKLNLKSVEGLTSVLETLKELEEECLIYRSNKDKFMPFNDSHLLKGRLSVNKRGYGFLILEGQDDLYIDPKNMNGALNNDIVVAEPIKVNGKTEARIIKVIKEENNLIVGEVNIKDGEYIFTPDDDKLKVEIVLDNKNLENLVDGHKVQISITKKLSKYKYVGEVIKIIGHKNDPGVDILSIVYDHGINDKFSDAVIKECEEMPTYVRDSDKKGRRDLTDKTICW